MEKHVQLVGVFNIAYGVLGLIPAFIVAVVLTGSGLLSGEAEAFFVTTGVGFAIAVFVTVISLPGIIGGLYLLNHREWARILVLVLGFMNFLVGLMF